MSYSDARQNRTVAFGAVAVVHAVLGYALLTGLATTVLRHAVDGPMIIYDVKDPPPPPPEVRPTPDLAKASSLRGETVTTPIQEVATISDEPLVMVSIDPAPSAATGTSPEPLPLPDPPPNVSLARGAAPRGDQGNWFPQDSYPAAARRANAQGKVSVRVSVGADGRVADCAVTASSGNEDLDAATCRLARRNGRFEPARDAQGSPVASSVALRNVHWRLMD